jgi:hypothetical protein
MRQLAAWMFVAFTAGVAAGPAPLSLRFVALDGTTSVADADGAVDLGAVAATRATDRRPAIVVLQRIGLRLDKPGASPASARVSVALDAESPGSVVRVDGIALSTVPRVVDAAHRLGTTVAHRIEVTIAPEVPAGPFASRLLWTAETE